jgi:hypothetical protein
MLSNDLLADWPREAHFILPRGHAPRASSDGKDQSMYNDFDTPAWVDHRYELYGAVGGLLRNLRTAFPRRARDGQQAEAPRSTVTGSGSLA